jgi:hypothetical protein
VDDLHRPSAGCQNTPELADLRVAELPPDVIYYGHFYGHFYGH